VRDDGRHASRAEELSSGEESRVIDFRAGLRAGEADGREGAGGYQKSCGRIVRRARCLSRRLKMYPTIEALRQTSEAGVFLIRFLGPRGNERCERLATNQVRRGARWIGARREGRAGERVDRNSLLKLIIQIGKMAI